MLRRWLVGAVLCLSSVSWSQEPAATEIASTQNIVPTIYTQVRNSEVLYASGPDLVLKLENGRVAHFLISPTAKFNMDSQSLSLNELRPGMRLTATIATAYAPELSPARTQSQAPEIAQNALPDTLRNSVATKEAVKPSLRLPATATPLPLMGLAGLGALLAGWVTRRNAEKSRR
jgi:hypothetical protein